MKPARFIPFLIWFGVILYLSFAPLSGWPKSNLFQRLYLDKFVHLFMYAVLAFLLIHAASGRTIFTWKKAVPAILVCMLTGILIECLQPVLTMYRQFEPLDMLANVAGVLSGWLLYSIWQKRRTAAI